MKNLFSKYNLKKLVKKYGLRCMKIVLLTVTFVLAILFIITFISAVLFQNSLDTYTTITM